MQKYNLKKWLKIFSFVILSIVTILVGIIALFVFSIAGAVSFMYATVGGILYLLFLLYVVFFKIFTPKKRKTILVLVPIFLIFTFGIYEFNRSRIESIPTVSDRGIELVDYKPFDNNSRVAVLDEPSNLKIEGDVPILDGATALYPLYSSFVQAVYPERDYSPYVDPVRCGGTIAAYQNLIDGSVDLIFAAKPSTKQLEVAKKSGVELELTPIGREAFVFFVNSQNPINSLTSRQIKDIYSGKISNWKDVGGRNEKIKAFQRPEGSGSQTMLQKVMEGEDLMTPPTEDIALSMGDIITETADYKNFDNALGYSFLIYATELVNNDQIKLVEIDGVAPNKETIVNKTYPLTADFYIVTAGSSNPNIEKFIQWVLSPQGRNLTEKTGYTPIEL